MVLLLMMIKESSSTKLNRCFYINNFRLKDRAVFYSFLGHLVMCICYQEHS
jgi:hypothetical protein